MRGASHAILGILGVATGVGLIGVACPALAQTMPASPAATRSATAEFYVQAYVNGYDKELIIRIDQEPDGLYIDADELTEIGIDVDGLALDPSRRIALDAIPGLTYDYRGPEQVIALDVPKDLLVAERIGYEAEPVPEPESGMGLVFNYALRLQDSQVEALATEVATRRRPLVPIFGAGLGSVPVGDARSYAARSETQDKTLSLATDLRLFTPYGAGVNYGVLTVQEGVSDYVRQDTYWTYSGVQSLRNYTAGDFISSALTWTRSVRLGGMQVARDFDIRPDLVTFPVPQLGSTAVVPTTVDLYVNGMRQFSGAASGGPFVIAAPPSLTGAGTASIVYRDELGRDVVTTRRMYVDTRLMDRGLADYSFEAGYLRQGYGTFSSLYAEDPVASASLRYGVRDYFTVEGHGEWGRGVRNGGIGGLLQVGSLGVLSGAVAASSSDGTGAVTVDDGDDSGMLTSVGYQYISPRWSLNLQDIRAHDNYRDLGSTDGSPVPRRTLNGNLGLSLGRNHSLTLNYSEQRDALLSGSRIASLGYSGSFGSRVQAFATAFRDLDLEDSNGVYVGLSITLDSRSSIHASSSRNGNDETHTLGASRAINSDVGGFGWDVYTERGNNDYRRGSARLDYEGRHGEFALEYDRTRSGGTEFSNTSLYASGALVLMDRDLLASRPIYDAFALVLVDGAKGVPVLRENRPAGVTDAQGHLLVPDLLAFASNRVAIDPLGLPLTQSVEVDRRLVAPRQRSGVLVRFPVTRHEGAVVMLVDAQGKPLPVGTQVTVVATGETAVMGYDGQVFIHTLQPQNTLGARVGDQDCVVEVMFDLADAMQTIGPFTCAVAGTRP